MGFCNGTNLILDSPFDFNSQVKLYLARTMPLPSESNYNDAAAEAIKDFVNFTQGRAFVLFTSYGMLRYCADALAPGFQDCRLSAVYPRGFPFPHRNAE